MVIESFECRFVGSTLGISVEPLVCSDGETWGCTFFSGWDAPYLFVSKKWYRCLIIIVVS